MKILSRKEWFGLIILVLFYVAIRLPGLHISYYQDEYKWPLLANPAVSTPGLVPHPPLTEFIFAKTAQFFGYDNFRLTPFLFGLANLILLYFVARNRFNKKTAFITTSLFVFSF